MKRMNQLFSRFKIDLMSSLKNKIIIPQIDNEKKFFNIIFGFYFDFL
jgi:hypothetical protein